MLANAIVLLIVAILFLSALQYIRRAKKAGVKCVGCPDSASCSACSSSGSTCGCTGSSSCSCGDTDGSSCSCHH